MLWTFWLKQIFLLSFRQLANAAIKWVKFSDETLIAENKYIRVNYTIQHNQEAAA